MQAYEIIVSDLAKSDLQNIVRYISEVESITTAKYVERGILSEMKKLERFPTGHIQKKNTQIPMRKQYVFL